MIYLNFLYFFIAIAVFFMAQTAPSRMFTSGQNLLAIVVIIVGFWYYNRSKFTQLRISLNNEEISLETAIKYYFNRINIHFLIAIALFTFEIFAFDLKFFILRIPALGLSELFVNTAGIATFILHLAIVWYWGFQAMGDVMEVGKSAENYIRSNIKFNLFIVIPYLILTFIIDILKLIHPQGLDSILYSPLYQIMFFGLFMLIFAILGPVLIILLWDCEPLPPSELKDKIITFCRSQGVRFKNIMSWNALNKSLVTAGVMGVVWPFRYLMITPALMKLLNEDEIIGVVSHEVGHVKKKHIILYSLFFLGFFILSITIMDLLSNFLFTTSLGIEILNTADGSLNASIYSLITISISLVILIGYFRFVFGFFMRNFERQADGYCFEAGIDPDHMVSSFMKLGVRLGEDSKKPNWHHYNLQQRIDFIRKGMQNPKIITLHNQKVKRRVTAFITVLILLSIVSFNAIKGKTYGKINLKRMASIIEQKLDEKPDNPKLYALLGSIYYALKEWKASEKAYRYSVGLDNSQPDVLNNLAWLLLKSEDESLRDPERALKLAKDAAKMDSSAHILDTLAEAYYQNKMFWKAYQAAKRALDIATENHTYFKEQLEKMKNVVKSRK